MQICIGLRMAVWNGADAMRIGVLFGYGLRGSGSCVYVRELVQTFCELGHDVTLVFHEGDPALLETLVGEIKHTKWGLEGEAAIGRGRLTVRSLAVERIPVTYPRAEISNGIVLSGMTPDAADEYVDGVVGHLLEHREQDAFDVVLVNHVGLLVDVAHKYRSVTGIPFRVVVHGTGIHYGILRSDDLRDRVAKALTHADAVVALNRSVRHRLRDALPAFAPIEYKQIPPGTDTKLFAYTSNKQNHVAYVGRLILDKGVHCLLAAWPIIAAANPGVELRLAGDGCDAANLRRSWEWLRQGDRTRFRDACVPRDDDAVCRTSFEQLLAPLDRFLAAQGPTYDWLCINAKDTVRFLGAQDRHDVAELICNARLMVLPSLAPEAHPLAVCEALAAGTPCIGPNEAGIKWILKRAEKRAPELRSRVRIPSDQESFVSGIARHAIALLRTPPKPATMLQVSSYVSERFSWNASAENVLSGFNEVVGSVEVVGERGEAR